MSEEGRILTGLMERRALEAGFRALAEARSLGQQAEAVEAIAKRGSAVIPVLLALLDTSDPQLRGGLGQVAAHLDRNLVVPALRNVIHAHKRSSEACLTALTILDRYLHEPIEEELLTSEQGPDAVAVQSVRELISEMERSESAVIEYLQQLAEQPPDVPGLLLNAVSRLPGNPHLVTLLRMLAQGEAVEVSRRALEQLGRMRLPEAAEALASLMLTIPPDRAGLAERSLRKLRLSGLQTTAATSSEWRALLSPVDGAGAQVIWFVRGGNTDSHGMLFSILVRDPAGIVGSFGALKVPLDDLPLGQPLGSLYAVPQIGGAPPLTLVAAPFDGGRQTVREALELNWKANRLPPLEYRFLNPLIWSHGPLAPPPEPEVRQYTPSETAALLDHPAFAGWFWDGPELGALARELGSDHGAATRTERITTLAETCFGPELAASYSRRLRGMGRWLGWAQETDAAALALAAAKQLCDIPPGELPLVYRLIDAGLAVASLSWRSGFDVERKT